MLKTWFVVRVAGGGPNVSYPWFVQSGWQKASTPKPGTMLASGLVTAAVTFVTTTSQLESGEVVEVDSVPVAECGPLGQESKYTT